MKHFKNEPNFVPGQVIVGMKKNRALAHFALSHDVFAGIEVTNIEVLANENTISKFTNDVSKQTLLLKLIEDDKQSVLDAIDLLEAHPDVEFAEPDYLFYGGSIDNDLQEHINSNFSVNWNLRTVRADQAWNMTTGRHSVRVGVIDSGVNHTHPSLARNVDTSLGHDFVLNRPDGMDVETHGTHVAGIIGGNHGVGVALNVTMVSLRVLNENGSGNASNIVRAINHANALGLDIINFSIGGRNNNRSMENAIRAFNGLFVTSAGNSSNNIDTQPEFPAALNIPNMITLGNSNQSNQRHSNSNFSRTLVDLFAPGTNIRSTGRGNSFVTMTGTSMAAPHVAGAAALALSVNPSLSPVELREAILSTVTPVPALANLSFTGGILNAERLVQHVMEERKQIPNRATIRFGTALNHTSVVSTRASSTSRHDDLVLWIRDHGMRQKFVLVEAFHMGHNVYQIWDHLEQEILAWNTHNNRAMIHPNESRQEHFWVLEPRSNGRFVISNLRDRNRVLDVRASGTSNGTLLQVHSRNGTRAQEFSIEIESVPPNNESNTNHGSYHESIVRFFTALNQTSVVSTRATSGIHDEVILWRADHSVRQRFGLRSIPHMGENVYQIWDHSDRQILAWNRPNNVSRQVFIARNENRPEHFWILEQQRDGTYIIANFADRNMVLDVSNANTNNGTMMQMHHRNGNRAQQFSIQVER